MSGPSTPKSLQSGSGDHLQSPSSNILTPTRKVKALLAQFDDDTGSEDELQQDGTNTSASRNPQPSSLQPSFNLTKKNAEGARSDCDDDEDLPVLPRGRMAARMQAHSNPNHDDANKKSNAENPARSSPSAQIDSASIGETNEQDDSQLSSEGQIVKPRRRLQKRKQNNQNEQPSREMPSRSTSPMFFPSPSKNRTTHETNGKLLEAAGSESEDLPDNLFEEKPNSRFLKLVDQQRKWRQEKESADARKRAERVEQLNRSSEAQSSHRNTSIVGSSGEDSEGDEGRTMQQSRPTRGASKKAIEEMRREQQRITRNMQLAHQAKTKKKITKESLLAKFNFFPSNTEHDKGSKPSAPPSSSSAPQSDAEGRHAKSTPPTSPPPMDDNTNDLTRKTVQAQTSGSPLPKALDDDFELPLMDDLLMAPLSTVDKGKGKAIEQHIEEPPFRQTSDHEDKPFVRPIRVRMSKEDAIMKHSSDDELDIVTSQPVTRRVQVFEKLPQRKAKETPSHLILRSLAHLKAPTGRGKQRQTMTAAEMDSSLRRQARLQAIQERAAKIEELKAKGVIVQTAEEREKEQREVEDLLEKARQEGAEIAKRERAIAEKNGEIIKDHLDDSEDDEDDGDFEDEDMNNPEGSDSGEDENEDENEDEVDEEEEENARDDAAAAHDSDQEGLIENEAEEQGSDEESMEDATDAESDMDSVPTVTPVKPPMRSRKIRIISDDEDGEEQTFPKPQSNKTPQSIVRSARKQIPGFPTSDDLPMGLSQAFAATMADSQPGHETQEQDSFSILQGLPEPEIPFVPQLNRFDSLEDITDSQDAVETQPLNLNLNFTQPRDLRRDSIAASIAGVSSTQFSELPEPTQDVGYVLSPWVEKRFDTPQRAPHSTVETVVLPASESPIVQRKGKLRRRTAIAEESDEAENADEDEVEDQGNDKYLIDPSAFDVMRRASARLRDRQSPSPDREKAKAEARKMVEEAAEESEDEYAGLGGASDDEVGEEGEEDRLMIDDEGREKLNERMVAKLHADKERTRDEAAVSKLLQDITTGALRRKRGAADDLDLSDEEDVHARRREAKRREFARMRKELLKSDERIEKIAEDPRKMAFLRAIEDLDDEEEGYGGGNEEPEPETAESQSQDAPNDAVEAAEYQQQIHTAIVGVLQPAPPSTTNRQLPAPLRRTTTKPPTTTANALNQKPASLTEIRESLSFLIEEPDSQASANGPLSPPASDSESDNPTDKDGKENTEEDYEEDDDEDDDMADFIVEDSQPSASASRNADAVFKKPPVPPPRLPGPQRRTKPPPSLPLNSNPRTDVVDRLSLLRQRSSSSRSSTAGGGAGSRMAFLASNGSAGSMGPGVPSLFRRATSNSSSFGSESGGTMVGTERQIAEDGKKRVFGGRGGGMRGTGTAAAGAGAVNYKGRMKGAGVREKYAHAGAGAGAGVGKMSAGGKGNGNGKKGAAGSAAGAGGFLKGFLGGSWD
ncbi:MAG: hypothetical protein Q9160_001898 [Pyrenula sp. 1 TL-2023]